MFRPAALLSFKGYIYCVHATEYATVCFCVAAAKVLTRLQSTEAIAIWTIYGHTRTPKRCFNIKCVSTRNPSTAANGSRARTSRRSAQDIGKVNSCSKGPMATASCKPKCLDTSNHATPCHGIMGFAVIKACPTIVFSHTLPQKGGINGKVYLLYLLNKMNNFTSSRPHSG